MDIMDYTNNKAFKFFMYVAALLIGNLLGNLIYHMFLGSLLFPHLSQ